MLLSANIYGITPIVGLGAYGAGLGTPASAPKPQPIRREDDLRVWSDWRSQYDYSEAGHTHEVLGAVRGILHALKSRAVITSIPKNLGCGYYGCVHTTDDPNVVVKVTTDASEAQNAQAIKTKQVKSQALPRTYEAWRVDLPGDDYTSYLIVRESLPDLPDDLAQYWRACGHDMPCGWEHPLATYEHCAAPPQEMVTFAQRISDLCKQPDMHLDDLKAANLGYRPTTGEVVIRDLGTSSLSPKRQRVRPVYVSKYRYVIGDLGIVSSAPLCLTFSDHGRHARIRNKHSRYSVGECYTSAGTPAKASCFLYNEESGVLQRKAPKNLRGAGRIPLCDSDDPGVPQDYQMRQSRQQGPQERSVGVSRTHKVGRK